MRGDAQSEGRELVERPMVAALDVVHAVQHRRPVGHGRGEYGGKAGAYVRQFDLGPVQLAGMMTVNLASRRVMEKCGMTYARTFFEDEDAVEKKAAGLSVIA